MCPWPMFASTFFCLSSAFSSSSRFALYFNFFFAHFLSILHFQKMTTNTRKSKLSSGKQEQYVFTWKVVNGWDYNIGEGETAASLAMANAIKLKVVRR